MYCRHDSKEKPVRVQDIMTRDVRTCGPEDTLATAAQIMWENDCGAVPVVDDEWRLLGIITDRDLAMAAHLQGVPLRDTRVQSAMAREVRHCSPHDTVATVESIMQRHLIRRVPVVDAERRVVGIVSLGDLAYLMSSQETLGGEGMSWTAIAHTLAAVSAPRSPRFRR